MTRKRLATFSFLGAGAAIGLALFVPLFGQFSRVLIVDSIDDLSHERLVDEFGRQRDLLGVADDRRLLEVS